MRSLFLLAAVSFGVVSLASAADEPPVVVLWENGPPGFERRKDEKEVRDRLNKDTGEYRVTNIHNPYVTVFLPPKEKATGAAVVIAPGGGFRELWVKHEGENVAQWLAHHGIAAFVLRYRLCREKDSPYKLDTAPREDGQRAVRLVRSKAKEWNLDPAHVGMMGFSAGGEVTSLTCRSPSKGDPSATDPIERESAMPSFNALIYSGPLGIIKQTMTKENSPPTFILVGDADNAETWLVQHHEDLRKAGVSSELHVLAKAPHGFGFRPYKSIGKPTDTWPQRFVEFLDTEGMLKK